MVVFCSSGDDNTSSVSRSMGEYSPFPVLVSHMMERAMTSSELYAGQWSCLSKHQRLFLNAFNSFFSFFQSDVHHSLDFFD